MKHVFQPTGVCSRLIHLEIEGDTLKDIAFEGGCNGNLQGIARLAKGRSVEEVISLVKGVRCGGKSTSCPDQLAAALEEALEMRKREQGNQ